MADSTPQPHTREQDELEGLIGKTLVDNPPPILQDGAEPPRGFRDQPPREVGALSAIILNLPRGGDNKPLYCGMNCFVRDGVGGNVIRDDVGIVGIAWDGSDGDDAVISLRDAEGEEWMVTAEEVFTSREAIEASMASTQSGLTLRAGDSSALTFPDYPAEPRLVEHYVKEIQTRWMQMLPSLPEPPADHYWCPQTTCDRDGPMWRVTITPVLEPIPGTPAKPFPPEED
ncbi:MAG: hypothetical protein ACLFVH_13210 [Phycisphaerae bacterium]